MYFRPLNSKHAFMNIQVINKSKHPLPAYATELSAGMDIRANLSEPITLEPLQRCLVPTGLYIALPKGFEAQVRPRSGLAIKKGITVLNSPGTIDADYRGEVCIILVNLSSETFVIEDGERIAQMVIAKHEQPAWQEVEVLDETETQVLFYQDSYAWVPYHQSSNGKTRSGKEVIGGDTYPYLATRECLEDVKAEDEMHVYQFSYDEIKKKCRSFLEAAEGEAEAKKALKFEDFEIQEKDSAGYVSKFRIGNTVCSGDEFRDALSLASSAFSIQEESGGLKITTMGKGHGLGMSQWTANELAKNGQNYKEILEFFFEGTTITNSEEILEKPE